MNNTVKWVLVPFGMIAGCMIIVLASIVFDIRLDWLAGCSYEGSDHYYCSCARLSHTTLFLYLFSSAIPLMIGCIIAPLLNLLGGLILIALSMCMGWCIQIFKDNIGAAIEAKPGGGFHYCNRNEWNSWWVFAILLGIFFFIKYCRFRLGGSEDT
jgi:hypothetical protein